ncbi:MAG: hypothetical protein ACD_73C00740G0004, partial [uncultured bacterium]
QSHQKQIKFMTTKEIPCPQCGKKSKWEGNLYRPFCSERCKLIDLGQWASNAYHIPGEPVDLEAIDHCENRDTPVKNEN